MIIPVGPLIASDSAAVLHLSAVSFPITLPPVWADIQASFIRPGKLKRGSVAHSQKENHMGKKLYVGNLSYDVDSSALGELFTPHGTVTSSQIIMDRDTGQSKGFGFVEMGSDQEAADAIGALNGQDHGGRALTVNEAKPKENRSGGGGSRGGYGGGGGGYAGATRGR